ncbi:MAG TPA: porin [Casimicrobiaceae bacterium]|nr:porin [Casimicrobiaceae bacterium]
MNKKLVAFAIAGAFALPAAVQAQTANVTMYGRANVDMEVVSGQQANGTNPHVFRVSSNSSRWGVRGTESLGGGLNAIFQLESSISWDAGGGTLAGRETFVGLQGSWGTFKMGNFLAPYDDIHPIFGNAPTLTTSILSTADLWAQGTLAKTAGGFDARLGNSIRYDSPNMSGLTASIQYSTQEGTPGQNSGVTSIGIYYNNGPIQVGSAYEFNEDVRGVGLDDHSWTIAGGYNFGFLRPSAVYETTKYDTPTGDLKRDLWGVGLTVPMGAGTWYAFYGHASDGKGSAATGTRVGGLAKGSDTSANQWELSYTYALSKRSLLYAGYVKLDNKCNASYVFNINPYNIGRPTGGCFGKPDGWLAGMVHFF